MWHKVCDDIKRKSLILKLTKPENTFGDCTRQSSSLPAVSVTFRLNILCGMSKFLILNMITNPLLHARPLCFLFDLMQYR